jgi:hypothetical protein
LKVEERRYRGRRGSCPKDSSEELKEMRVGERRRNSCPKDSSEELKEVWVSEMIRRILLVGCWTVDER